jgi:hypothetical protein
MIDPVQLQQLQQVVEKAATGGGSGPGKADAGAVSQFEQALAQPGPQGPGATAAVAPAGGPEAPAAASGTPPVDGASSPGDSILQGIDKLRSSFHEKMQQIGETLGKDKVSAQDMVRAQIGLQEISLQQDLLGKVGGKATQSIDQLLKG